MVDSGINLEEIITQIVSEEEPESFIVDIIKLKRKSEIVRVILDGDSGIRLEQCVNVNRKISEYLENNFPDLDINVEVFSPGVGNPLKLLRQYPPNIGRKLNVLLIDGESYSGKLIQTDNDSITLQWMSRDLVSKKKVLVDKKISFSSIKEAKVEVQF